MDPFALPSESSRLDLVLLNFLRAFSQACSRKNELANAINDFHLVGIEQQTEARVKQFMWRSAYSDHIHGMRGNPNVHLPEPLLQRLLELLEKNPMLRQVWDIHKEPRKVIPKSRTLMFSGAMYQLGFPRSGTKTSSQLGKGLGQQGLRHGAAIVKQQRHQDLVPA